MMRNSTSRFVSQYIQREQSIAPLVVLRILFGGIMAISILRFYLKGWIEEQYIKPEFFFKFYGFEWVTAPGETGMYMTFSLMFLSALGIMAGWFYRFSALLFFILFSYVELLDQTNYLNHYYFVSLMAFLLLLTPAHRAYSLDARFNPHIRSNTVPAWCIIIFKVQLCIVYFFAGIAKLNYDWLVLAMPLKIWLPSVSDMPLLGYLLEQEWVAYTFSWTGALYDLTIPFLLWNNRTRPWAFIGVVLFHLTTGLLFQIGMFPYIMILCTLIFFSEEFHKRILHKFVRISGPKIETQIAPSLPYFSGHGIQVMLATYLLLQIFLPMRHLLYDGSVFWTEQGYRFSWRVMLMEKAGYTQFRVCDADNHREEWVDNYKFLTRQQEKMMSTQPDMIIQFAHYLEKVYREKGYENPRIYCHSKVTLNGRRSTTFIDPEVDLSTQARSFRAKEWIKPVQL